MWALTAPLLVAGLTQIIVNIVDTIMLARYSTTALGAFALAAPVYLIALVVVRGWATAVQIKVAQAHGAANPAAVAQAVRVGLGTSLLAGAAIGVVLYAVAEPVLTVLGAPAELIGPGVAYLRVLAFAVPFAAASFTLQSACSGVGVTRASMYNALLVNAVNLPLGLWLIFSADLGVTGAALATLAATAAGTTFLLRYARARLPKIPGDGLPVAGTLWRIGWPEMSAMGVGYLNEALIAGFAARMGTPELAAYRIVDNLLLVVFTVMASASASVAILAGHEIGAGDHAAAIRWRATGVRLLLIVYAVPSALVLLGGTTLLTLFTGNADVVALAWQVVPIAVLSLAPMVPAMAYGSFLRAHGDTRSVMIASIAGDYLVLIPLAWLLGLTLGFGLTGIYVAWIAFTVLLAVLLWRRTRAHVSAEAGRPGT
ncbi:MATE family efflux transporter [Acrocarpospora phusangensis]|uniref:Probable multidrug resistance protein NorM n=1 Tax=Acrocarpospora phusangensis TaxID=1070424 RepID=A0A919UJ03_9ACTN|nr:MATE family efflux transporter [Acrocarpospora phusangensis]GIH23599.1 MATE family efflux transporter [Acrocarpospora phusangensis]